MSKTLDAVLAAARERISAGRNTGSPSPTKLGDKPAVDYAPKAGDERKFAAKHTHIDQEYPYGNKALFTGEKVPYSLTTPAAKHMGNTLDKAVKAYESVDSITEDDDAESIHKKLHGHWLKNKVKWTAHIMKGPKGTKHVTVTHSDGSSSIVSSHKDADRIIKEEVEQVDEISKDKVHRYIDKSEYDQSDRAYQRPSGSKGHADWKRKYKNRNKGLGTAIDKVNGKAKVNATEEVKIDEMWKATQGEDGKHVLKHAKTGQVSKKSYESKGEAIDAAVRLNRQNNHFKEDFEQVDEISRDRLKVYAKKADQGFGKDNDRAKGIALAHKKLWGDKKYGFKEPKVKASEEVEQIDNTLAEISKGKAARYITQAHNQGANARSRADAAARDRDTEREKKNDKKDDKRSAGISIAAAKLSGSAKVNAKEEVEQVDEISKKVIGSYLKKAKHSYYERGDKSRKAVAQTTRFIGTDHEEKAEKKDDHAMHKWRKRGQGIDKAVDRLTKEEIEQVNEISGKTLGSYIQKARGDAEKRRAHSVELSNHPSVKKHAEKRSEYYSRKEYDSRGRSKHADKINASHDREAKAKEKIDPNYRKTTNYGKRHRGIEKAVDKLKSGKLTELTQTQIDAVIEAAVLCDKNSLGKKMSYHKKKLKAEDIGSPKFKHHQRQAHIIKGMLEDKEEE